MAIYFLIRTIILPIQKQIERDIHKEEDTEKVHLNGNQILDGTESNDAEQVTDFYRIELKVKAHEDCKNYDVIENIEVNYDGTLNDLIIEKNDIARYILVQKECCCQLRLSKQSSEFGANHENAPI